jgi:hypothetical protein
MIEIGSTVDEPEMTTEPPADEVESFVGASVESELPSSLPQAAATSMSAMAPPRRLRRRDVVTCRSPSNLGGRRGR